MDKRYHLYQGQECIANTLTEDKFKVLMNEYHNNDIDVTYEVVDMSKIGIEESSY